MSEMLVMHCVNHQCRVETFIVYSSYTMGSTCPGCYGAGKIR